MYRLLFILWFSGFLAFAQDKPEYQSVLLKPELTKYANSIFRNDEMRITLKSQRKMEIYSSQVVTVLNEEGLSDLNTAVSFDKNRSINRIQAVVYDRMGNEIKKYRRGDFRERSAVSGGQLYMDDRILYIDHTPVSYPFTMEFTYEVETSATAFIPSWYIVSRYSQSVERSLYEVIYKPEEMQLEALEKNLDQYPVKVVKEPGVLRYEASDLPAVKYEDLALPFIELAPAIEVVADRFHLEGIDGDAMGWKDLGKWMYDNLVDGRQSLPESTVRKVRELTEGVDDPLEKARIVYEFMQNNTRYIGVQVGIGGFQPIAAIEVDKVKYGDCKGLSNYTKALLEAVGIESYYVHVEAGNANMNFDPEFASISQGNHAILAMPYGDSLVWMECTSQVTPFNFLGDFTDNRNVMLMKPEGGEIVRTPAYLAKDNHLKTVANILVKEDGSIEADIRMESRGLQYDDRFYRERMSERDQKDLYRESWSYLGNMNLKTLQLENDRKEVVFTEKLNISALDYLSNAGAQKLFNPNVFNRLTGVPARYRDRKLPFRIRKGFTDKDEFRITLPKGFQVETLPDPQEIVSDFGAYRSACTLQEDGSIVYSREVVLHSGDYPAEKYEAYRDFRRKIQQADSSKILLNQVQPD